MQIYLYKRDGSAEKFRFLVSWKIRNNVGCNSWSIKFLSCSLINVIMSLMKLKDRTNRTKLKSIICITWILIDSSWHVPKNAMSMSSHGNRRIHVWGKRNSLNRTQCHFQFILPPILIPKHDQVHPVHFDGPNVDILSEVFAISSTNDHKYLRRYWFSFYS